MSHINSNFDLEEQTCLSPRAIVSRFCDYFVVTALEWIFGEELIKKTHPHLRGGKFE